MSGMVSEPGVVSRGRPPRRVPSIRCSSLTRVHRCPLASGLWCGPVAGIPLHDLWAMAPSGSRSWPCLARGLGRGRVPRSDWSRARVLPAAAVLVAVSTSARSPWVALAVLEALYVALLGLACSVLHAGRRSPAVQGAAPGVALRLGGSGGAAGHHPVRRVPVGSPRVQPGGLARWPCWPPWVARRW